MGREVTAERPLRLPIGSATVHDRPGDCRMADFAPYSPPMSDAHDNPESTVRRLLTLAGLLLVALNLRPALTSISPVLTRIGHDLGLASAGQGVLGRCRS